MTWYSKLLLLNGPLATFSLAVVVNQKLLTSYAFISLKTKELVFYPQAIHFIVTVSEHLSYYLLLNLNILYTLKLIVPSIWINSILL